jgi:hypothetical protein
MAPKSTGIPGIIFVKENGRRPPPSPNIQATSDKLEAFQSGMHAPGVKSSHTWHTANRTKDGGTRCMEKYLPLYSYCACTTSFSFPLSSLM